MLNAIGGTVAQSVRQIRDRISTVGWHGNGIRFSLDGVVHDGDLKGRNADCMLCGVPEIDAALAARVLLDGHARPVAI